MPGAFLGWRDGATLRYDNHASRRTAVHADAASDCWRPRDTPRQPPRSGGGAGTSWRPAALLVQPQPASRAASWWTASRAAERRRVPHVTCARYAADSSNAAVNTLLPSAHGTRSTFTPHREHDTRHGVYCSHTGIRPHGRCRHTRAGRPQRATERVPPQPDETGSRQRSLDPKR